MRLCRVILLLLLLVGSVSAEELKIGQFSSNDLKGWDEKSFDGNTVYTLVSSDKRIVLQARSSDAASGLFRKVRVSPTKFPLLKWSWKVSRTLDREDATKKYGDDFAARVYVVFPRTFFWQTRAINYVWSARLPVGTVLPCPFTANSMYYVVESGNGKAGTWVSEEHNYLEDYRRIFHEEPPQLGAIAVMTDTDNTHSSAMTWYGDITLHDLQ